MSNYSQIQKNSHPLLNNLEACFLGLNKNSFNYNQVRSQLYKEVVKEWILVVGICLLLVILIPTILSY